VEPQGAGHEEIRYRQVAGVEPQQGPASEATDKRRGANSPSSNTQRTRGSAPKTADFDPTSKPQRAAANKGVGTKSGAAGKK
jgi:hypothetical protein